MSSFVGLTVLAAALSAGLGSYSGSESQTPAAPKSKLGDTLESIRLRIDDDSIDSLGIHKRSTFVANGCTVSFRDDGGSVTLLAGTFDLKDISFIDVVDRPVGTVWTGTFLVFKTGEARPTITKSEWSVTDNQLHPRMTSSFDWQLGAVHAGASTKDLQDRGLKLSTLFGDAIGLCGGIVRNP
jgi:hypothetical protein